MQICPCDRGEGRPHVHAASGSVHWLKEVQGPIDAWINASIVADLLRDGPVSFYAPDYHRAQDAHEAA